MRNLQMIATRLHMEKLIATKNYRNYSCLFYTVNDGYMTNRTNYIQAPVNMHNYLFNSLQITNTRCLSEIKTTNEVQPPTNREKFKKAIKEYGTTVIVFHISISLISLGVCYVLVSSGYDLETLLQSLGLSEKKIDKPHTKTGFYMSLFTFYKLLMPVRISLTSAATPLIVRHLRKIGYLKKT